MALDKNLTKAFLEYLTGQGVLSDQQVLSALDRQRELTSPIGRIALQTRTLTMKQVNATLSSQLGSELRFGEQAIALGFMDRTDLEFLLTQQDQMRPKIGQVLIEMGIASGEEIDRLRVQFAESTAAILV